MSGEAVYVERFGGITCAACKKEICIGQEAIRSEAEMGALGRSYHVACPPDGKTVRENRTRKIDE